MTSAIAAHETAPPAPLSIIAEESFSMFVYTVRPSDLVATRRQRNG